MDECPWRERPRHGTLAAVMQPSLRERLGWRGQAHLVAEDRTDRAVMARSLMYLFAAGGAGSLGSLVLAAGADEGRAAITAACAFGRAARLLAALGPRPAVGAPALRARVTCAPGVEGLFGAERERAGRGGPPLSVLVGALAGFKAINDRYGNAAGDRALGKLSEILQQAKRRVDTAARIGGEEFAVIAPDSDHHAAYILAERMRRGVRETFTADPFALTISLGVATFPRHGATAAALIAGGDEALYAAKKLGRDRTVVYNAEISETLKAATGGSTPRSERHSSTVLALAEVIDIRDTGTATHSETVGRYAGAIARELGLESELVERVRFGGIVHDVGKIGISDAVLRKPGWLSDEDWTEMRRHPEIGARILRGANLGDIGDWILAHHERPDGQGYPAGLSGTEIPLEARILAVADTYEAMTSERVYRPAMSAEAAREELRQCAGTQFDGRVVEAFLTLLDRSEVTRELPVGS